MTHKHCRKCGETKPVAEFDWIKYIWRNGNLGGHCAAYCKPCSRVVWKQTSETLTEEQQRGRKNRELLRAYGISLERFEAMDEAQGGLCAICRRGGRRLVVDHCHTSNRVRGLLCQQCNAAVGMLYDDPEAARRLIDYLSEHHAKERHQGPGFELPAQPGPAGGVATESIRCALGD